MTLDAAFWRLYGDLPQAGPGTDAATVDVLRRLPPLPPSPKILDLGCGPGRQTLALARTLQVSVTGVDTHQPYLDRLQRTAEAQGVGHLIATRCASMDALDDPPGTFDLMWSEGAIYVIGFEAGLRLWRPLLKPRGLVVVSEATWLTDSRPAEIAAYWNEGYPAIGTVAQKIERAAEAGYETLDHVALPSTAWDAYYGPVLDRVAELRPEAEADPSLAQVLDETEREIDMFRRYGDTYGYVFYALRRRD